MGATSCKDKDAADAKYAAVAASEAAVGVADGAAPAVAAASAAGAGAGETAKSKPRVLVIGLTGQGKSSVCRLLTNRNDIAVSDAAGGCTVGSATYDAQHFTITDTVGLGEGPNGKVSSKDAITALVRLVHDTAGFNLLLFVREMEPRVKGDDQLHYQLFHDVVCEAKIPMVLCITKCEHSAPMDKWWVDNHQSIIGTGPRQYGWRVREAVSVCTLTPEHIDEQTKPDAADDDDIKADFELCKQRMLKRRAASRDALSNAILKHSLSVAHKPTPRAWYERAWRLVVKLFRDSKSVNPRTFQILHDLKFAPEEIAKLDLG